MRVSLRDVYDYLKSICYIYAMVVLYGVVSSVIIVGIEYTQ